MSVMAPSPPRAHAPLSLVVVGEELVARYGSFSSSNAWALVVVVIVDGGGRGIRVLRLTFHPLNETTINRVVLLLPMALEDQQ